MRRDQGWPVESIKVATENILKSYEIARSAYHGGNFIGTHCWLLLDSCDKIVTRVARVSIEQKKKDIQICDNSICQRCDKYCKLIQCLDATFALLNLYSPNESYIQKLDSMITETLRQWRKLGISITTKSTLLTHCTEQMIEVKDFARKKKNMLRYITRYI